MYYDEEEIRRKAEKLQKLVDKGMNSNNLDTALKYLDEATAMAEEDGISSVVSMIWGMKACKFMDAGAPPIIAINCLKKGIAIDPTYDVNYEVIGTIYLEIDEPEIAMRYFNQGKMLSNKY